MKYFQKIKWYKNPELISFLLGILKLNAIATVFLILFLIQYAAIWEFMDWKMEKDVQARLALYEKMK